MSDFDTSEIFKPLVEWSNEKRKNKTIPEDTLWREVVNLNLHNQIECQKVIGWFIVDFFFRTKALIIEIDGSSHEGREDYDRRREIWLASKGFKIVRYTNEQVMENPFKIVEELLALPKVKGWRDFLQIATNQRRCENEIKLAKKGLKHSSTGSIVPINEYTDRQRTSIHQNLNKIAHVRAARNGRRRECPFCKERFKSHVIRCLKCSAIFLIVPNKVSPKGTLEESNRQRRIHYLAGQIKSDLLEVMTKSVRVRKGRIQGRRPRCPSCGRGLAQSWKTCQGCQAVIEWEES